MSKPRILTDLDKKVETSDDEEFGDTMKVHADTLGGEPPEYYASKADVSQIMMNYMAAVLGKSY